MKTKYLKTYPTTIYLFFFLFMGSSAGTGLQLREAEFIFRTASFPSCHASTIVETETGELLAAWFGGTREGDDDVEIWLSARANGGGWSQPRPMTQFPEIPCWNPVLFCDTEGSLWLFFKIGPNPRSWIGAYRTSKDSGRTWSDIEYLPAGLVGPIKNKPIILTNGDLLSGTSVEAGYRKDTPLNAPYRSWSSWVERSEDGGKHWSIHGPITLIDESFGVIQPTLWEVRPGVVKMLMRATQRVGFIAEAISTDGGRTWSPARPTTLPNPNAGIDAVKLRDGRICLAYNHTSKGRSPLNVALSEDNAENWSEPFTLEMRAGEYSYPAIIQGSDGAIHITYTWNRKQIKHVVLNLDPVR